MPSSLFFAKKPRNACIRWIRISERRGNPVYAVLSVLRAPALDLVEPLRAEEMRPLISFI
jgi:hypothetical protein